MTPAPQRMVIAIDPGPEMSAVVQFDGDRIINHVRLDNADVLLCIQQYSSTDDVVLVIEQIAAMGMAVGAEVFETCVWSGRFIQAWLDRSTAAKHWDRVKRHEVKTALCGNQRAKDPNIRQALIDRFGPGKDRAIGSKAKPGPLYGIAGDEWSALAVAVTWWDRVAPAARERSA